MSRSVGEVRNRFELAVDLASWRHPMPEISRRAIALADERQRFGELDQGVETASAISMDIELAASRLEALGHATRLRVYRALVQAGHAGLPVRELQERAAVATASTMSHHLHRLVLAGLVEQERRSTTLICRACFPAMEGLVSFLSAGCGIDEEPATDPVSSKGQTS